VCDSYNNDNCNISYSSNVVGQWAALYSNNDDADQCRRKPK